jgi:hypothetical protein
VVETVAAHWWHFRCASSIREEGWTFMRTTSQEDLLLYYQRELTYLRKMGAAFAARYPKVASRLELGRTSALTPRWSGCSKALLF